MHDFITLSDATSYDKRTYIMTRFKQYLEVITWPPSGPRANMECRADMPGNATVDMF